MLYALLNLFGAIAWIVEKVFLIYFIVLAICVLGIITCLTALVFEIIRWAFT